MKKIRNAALKLAAFIGFYIIIFLTSYAIQFFGYILTLDRVFGVLFDPSYAIFASSCDRVLTFNNIILFTVSFILIWLSFSKKMDASSKKIFTISYSVLILTMIGRLLPAGIGSC